MLSALESEQKEIIISMMSAGLVSLSAQENVCFGSGAALP